VFVAGINAEQDNGGVGDGTLSIHLHEHSEMAGGDSGPVKSGLLRSTELLFSGRDGYAVLRSGIAGSACYRRVSFA
jgi:hypothetical protein